MRLPVTYDIHRPREQEKILELCASHYFHMHAGWECEWPLSMGFSPENGGDAIVQMKVGMEREPVFTAYPLRES